MATEKENEQDKTEPVKAKSSSGKGGLLVWLILGAVVVAGATGGFALSQLVGGTVASDPNAVQVKPAVEPKKAGGHGAKAKKSGHGGGSEKSEGPEAPEPGKSWMYDKLDAMVANLNEPGVTRFVRVTVILEISGQADYAETMDLLNEKKIEMQDWMATYLAGLSLEDVRGSRNLTRIKQEVLNEFNQILFNDGKSFVDRVLFKEFAVQ
jgi:flagellar basal body-associated protein FliL